MNHYLINSQNLDSVLAHFSYVPFLRYFEVGHREYFAQARCVILEVL